MVSSIKSLTFGSIRRHVVLLGMLLCIVLLTQPGFASKISQDLAIRVARNFLSHIGSAHTISVVEPLVNFGQQVGYLVKLSPRGYILVAGDTIRVPVKGYSLNSTFSDLPEAYVQNLLGELQVPAAAVKSAQPENTNAPYWEYLTEYAARASSSYMPDTFLLTTRWNQGYPYNKLNPTVDGDLTLTGCVQTAAAQLMRYHSHPPAGSGVFTHTWNDQSLTAVMNRPFNWDVMPDTVNGSVPEYQQDEVAALMRDLGILNQADFGVSSTSTAFRYNHFGRAFGYGPISSMSISSSEFFSTIRDEINNLRPVLLSMPGHMTVADGYASDGTGKKIHVNLGWGGAHDDYYYLDQTNVIGPYTFPPNHIIYYSIRPCEGDECNPYDPTGGGNPPLLGSVLNDKIIDSGTTIRIEAFDPDGDPVTLSAASSCSSLQADLNANLLTLTPNSSDIFCQVTVNAQTHDGSSAETFKVLCLDDMIYLGVRYDIGGQFADQNEVDEYTAYLGGDTTISGDRGYSNQAFYIWVKDQGGNTVIAADDDPVSGNLAPGLYTVAASLKNMFTGHYYSYNADYSSYILNVTCHDLSYTVADLAASLGISLSTPDLTAVKTNDVNGATTLGSTWTWSLSLSNIGNGDAVFTDGQTLLLDSLPSGGLNYGDPTIMSTTGITNADHLQVFIDGNDDLVVSAAGADVTVGAGDGTIAVGFSVTPTTTGTFDNPRAGGTCRADPNNEIVESIEANNASSDSVTVTCQLTLTKAGNGDGTVISSPPGIDCGLACSEPYTCGTDVTLAAVPDAASMFTDWSGDCSGETLSTLLTVDVDKNCTATFKTDADQDRMPDDWEVTNGLDPTVDDADLDKDGDGVSNVDEYNQGTDPDSPSGPKFMPWIQLLLE